MSRNNIRCLQLKLCRRMPLVLFLLALVALLPLILHEDSASSLEYTVATRLARLRHEVAQATAMGVARRRDVIILADQLERRSSSGGASVDKGAIAQLYHPLELNPDMDVPGVLLLLPHLASSADRRVLTPIVHLSADTYLPYNNSQKERSVARRRNVTVALGVPSARRALQSYLVYTLANLVDNMSPTERRDSLIVVLLAETDEEYCRQVCEKIQARLSEAVQSGLLEVISPRAGYYPPASSIRASLNDPIERVRWRTKQNLDFAYLMMYCRQRALYYVQLEDDIVSKPNFVTEMTAFASAKSVSNKDWLVLDFCQLGFIGKMLRCSQLMRVINSLLLFHNDQPSDWLLMDLINNLMCGLDRTSKDCRRALRQVWLIRQPSLFQHIGIHSSLKGKTQKLKDKKFGSMQLFVPHDNPAANVTSSLAVYKTYSLARAYKGETFFWGLSPRKGGFVQFTFLRDIRLVGYLFRSGNAEHLEDIVYNGSVSVASVIGPPSLDNSTSTANLQLNWTTVGRFDVTGLATGTLPASVASVRAIRVLFESDSDKWVIFSEIHLKTA